MNNYNYTQSLDALNNIEADNINTSNLNVDNLLVNSILRLNAGSRYYSGTNYTEFLQTGTQLTIKPVSINGSLALFSSAPSTGIQTQQLLINNSGLTSTTLTSSNIFSSNYGTTTATGTTEFSFGTTSGIIYIGKNITTGSINLGTATSTTNIYNILQFYHSVGNYSTIKQSSNILNIENPTPSSSIYLKTRASIGAVQDSIIITASSTSINNLLLTNNITAPSSSIAGVNNIYTNLDPINGLGIINIGTYQNNINIKCNLNIVESVYNNLTKITTINQEGNSCRFTNNGSTNGNFIFTINEGSTYNPLVINKTSVNIAGDAVVGGNLILYDTTPSTKNVIIELVGNDLFFTPYLNVPSSTYNFKVSDSSSTITTPLIINSTNTTIYNNLISNSQATFNNICPISNTNATLNNHLTTLGFNNNTYVDFASVQSISGIKTFLSALYLKNEMRIYDIISPFTNYTKLYTSGGAFVIYPDYPSSSIQFYCRTAGNLEVQTFYSFATGNTSAVHFTASSTSSFSGTATFNSWVYLNFRTRIYDLNGLGNYSQMYMLGNALILAPNANGDTIQFYCKDATLGQLQTFTSSALGNTSNVNLTCSYSLISNNLTSPLITGTHNIYTTITSGSINIGSSTSSCNLNSNTYINTALFFKDTTNQSKIDQVNTDLQIDNNVNSGAINFNTTDSLSSLATRASILEDQFYFQVPLTISIGASLYSSFTSNTIGYKTSNTGSSQTLTSGSGVNSGQLASLDQGVWKIDYTATINITTTITTLTTLEVFVASSANVDLDIQGLDVKNFYGVGITATQKIKISASGTLINSGAPATYNLRLIPVFTGGAGNFVGSISATRIS